MYKDFLFSLRSLRNNPGFAIVAILTLALGIGANTAIFSVVNHVLLQPLPYPNPERLLYLDESMGKTQHMSGAWPNFVDWQAQNRSFEAMAAIRNASYNLTGGGDPEVVKSLNASASIFDLLGANAVIGHFYTEADDKAGAAPVVVLTHAFWQRRFGGDRSVVGRAITLDNTQYTVAGVLDANFRVLGRSPDLLMPIGLSGATTMYADRGNHVGIRVIAKLRRGITVDGARADMDAIAGRLAEQYPVTNAGVGVMMEPYFDVLVKDARPTLNLLFAAVGFVLLTACANVANLLLARGSARQRELSIRAALGASRARVVRQLLVESVTLALIGGALGTLVAWWSLKALLALAPNVPRLQQASLDGTVLVFTLLVSLAVGVLFGLLPALRLSRPDLTVELKTGGRGQSVGRASRRLRSTLLVAEVALALVMMTGAGLMIRSIYALQSVSPGFVASNVTTFTVSLPENRYGKPVQRLEFFRQALDRVRAIPGVESAAEVNCIPLDGGCWGSVFTIDGRPAVPNSELPHADFNLASADYFKTLRVPLVAGRVFNARETFQSPKVALINESMARHLFPNENPIGKRFKQGYPQYEGTHYEIVGIVGDVQRYELDHAHNDEIYMPMEQNAQYGASFVVRTAGAPPLAAFEAAIHSLDKDQPLAKMRPMSALLAETLAQRRFSTILLAVFAALALSLAAVGIYGVTSYGVTLRTQEVGIRMALGARQGDVLKLMLGQGLALALIGVAAGLATSGALTWLITRMLYGVNARDPITLAASSLLLVAVAAAACYVPARRAAKLDPVVALRTE